LLQASAADELVREIRDLGGEAVALKADVSRDDEVRTMFDRLVEAFGRIDILVANAGIQKDSAITDMSLEDWRAGRALVTTGSCTLRSATPTKTRVFARSAPRPSLGATPAVSVATAAFSSSRLRTRSPCWKKRGRSLLPSLDRLKLPCLARFVADSPVEQEGFEPLVSLAKKVTPASDTIAANGCLTS
jgi:hypothetical protein